ncbi:V-set and immunoglobulin domain-containing protein 10-like isoform X2 [Siphateles boraxobius]|uniref:V-set and immunoglobulin domain-containing protein 10-like isoform X2 n=1 Tax=Siphateles boraxobius TaxID=180520 RepID=UPI00406360F0
MQTLFSLISVLLFWIAGNLCNLSISPTGPVSVEALVGTSVTLAVSHAGVSRPEVMWFMGDRLIARWTVGDGSLSGVALDILKPEQDGSLTFRNVSLNYNGTYTVEMTQIGEAKVSATFDLFVYDIITNASLHTVSEDCVEGEEKFSLYYSTMRGEAKEVRWFFNGLQVKNASHYSIAGQKLTINQPSRSDAGHYTVLLTNPFSNETLQRNITVLYGPDKPVLKVSPTKAVFVSGESLFLSCQAEGEPAPSTSWFFNAESIATSGTGTVHLTNLKTSQSGVYTCVMVNTRTKATLQRNLTVIIYEAPSGGPYCSVQTVNGALLQFLCVWPGGAPEAQVSFPGLSQSASGYGNYSITINDTQRLHGQEIICKADHPLNQTQCSVIPRAPVDFLPVILTSMSEAERMTVVIRCSAEATPEALVRWIKNGDRLQTGSKYQISTNTTQLFIHDFNATSSDLDTYTCTAINPLGNTTMDTTLLGPRISNSSVFLSDDQTEVTLIWLVPLTSVITGFDIQMKGPELSSPSQPKRNIMTDFHTIRLMPASARNTTVSGIDPKSTYSFRILPKAGRNAGEPSDQHRIGPAAGLSGASIAGFAAGIPCAVLLLLVLLGFIYCGTRDRSPRDPVSRAVEKAVVCGSPLKPQSRQRGRLKPPPDYRLQQPERSGPLPSVNPCVRLATTV